jgi:hypothetical protein
MNYKKFIYHALIHRANEKKKIKRKICNFEYASGVFIFRFESRTKITIFKEKEEVDLYIFLYHFDHATIIHIQLTFNSILFFCCQHKLLLCSHWIHLILLHHIELLSKSAEKRKKNTK